MRSKKATPTTEVNFAIPSNAYLNMNISDMEGEVWLPMYGREKTYHVSTLGRIKKILKTHGGVKVKKFSDRESIIIEQVLGKDGNIRFYIGQEPFLVSEIVAKTYSVVKNSLNLKEIGHINGIKTDNSPNNLEYCETNSDAIIAPYVLCDWKRIPSYVASNVTVVKVSKFAERLSVYPSIKAASEKENISEDSLLLFLRNKDFDTKHGCYWMHLINYFRNSRFANQARLITKHQKANHPWLI